MIPKEKALELTEKFIAPTMDRGLCNYYKSVNIAKECALITADEILKYFKHNGEESNIYWQEVKKEIEKL